MGKKVLVFDIMSSVGATSYMVGGAVYYIAYF